MRSRLDELYSKEPPQEVKLFMARLPQIRYTLDFVGVQLPEVKDVASEVWQWCCGRNRMGKSGRRIVVWRFLSGPAALTDAFPWWGVDAFETEYLCLELGLVARKKLLPILLDGS